MPSSVNVELEMGAVNEIVTVIDGDELRRMQAATTACQLRTEHSS